MRYLPALLEQPRIAHPRIIHHHVQATPHGRCLGSNRSERLYTCADVQLTDYDIRRAVKVLYAV